MTRSKTFAILATLMAITTTEAYSAPVDRSQALARANEFFLGAPTRNTAGWLSLIMSSEVIATKADASCPTFYVFAPEGANGFVIISGDDSMRPVLGYSFKEDFPAEGHMPDGLRAFLEAVDAEVASRRISGAAADISTAGSWVQTRAGVPVVELQTALWGQGEPFNNDCPVENGTHCKTGCTATASAIMMKYFKWPASGTGSTAAYTTKNGISVPSRALGHKYDWDKMPLDPTNITPEQAAAVATLMADIGASYKANYGASSTSATISNAALYENFSYNPGSFYAYAKNTTPERWLEMQKAELLAKRPVLINAKTSDGGSHEFLLDGFSNDNYFHVNWGWEGKYNGYFLITDLRGYTVDQASFFKMYPADGSTTVEEWLKMRKPGLAPSVAMPEKGQPFTMDIKVVNGTAVVFDGKIKVGITGKDGKVKEWISDETSFTLNKNNNIRTISAVQCCFSSEPQIGDVINVYYQAAGETQWSLITTYEEAECLWRIPLADEYYLKEKTDLEFDREAGILLLRTKEDATITLKQKGGAAVTDGVSLSPGKAIVQCDKLKGGSYTFRIEKGTDVLEFDVSLKDLK